MSEQTLTLLNRTEASTLQSFVGQVDAWLSQHGDKAQTVEIVYYLEDDSFEVVNNEPNSGALKRNRATLFRTEILSWGVQQIKNLQGWNNDKVVTAFACVYKDGQFGVLCQVVDQADYVAEAEPASI